MTFPIENISGEHEDVTFAYGPGAMKLPLARQVVTSMSAVGDSHRDRGMEMVHPNAMLRSRRVCSSSTVKRMLPVSSTQIQRREARAAAHEFEKRERIAKARVRR